MYSKLKPIATSTAMKMVYKKNTFLSFVVILFIQRRQTKKGISSEM